ncbi:hypothetical protein GCM10027344_30060 [Spelaeicoccus albus]
MRDWGIVSKFFTVGDEQITELILDEAARVIERGDLIVLPTDTVYGIGADAFSPRAVEDLLEAKRRGRDMPPPVLIPRVETLQGIASDVPDDALKLVGEYWPGPLTIICNAQPSLDWDLGDTHGTVGVRVPDNETALALLRQTGPMAVSSANLSGMPPAKTAAEARDQLDDSIALYLEAGESGGREPSTIVDCTVSPMRVLRSGGLSIDALREVVPSILDLGEEPPSEPTVEEEAGDESGDSNPDEPKRADQEAG